MEDKVQVSNSAQIAQNCLLGDVYQLMCEVRNERDRLEKDINHPRGTLVRPAEIALLQSIEDRLLSIYEQYIA